MPTIRWLGEKWRIGPSSGTTTGAKSTYALLGVQEPSSTVYYVLIGKQSGTDADLRPWASRIRRPGSLAQSGSLYRQKVGGLTWRARLSL